MSAIRAVTAALLTAVALAGCPRPRPGVPETLRAPVVLRIDNRAQQDVTIYLVRGSHRTRLGSVTGLSAGAFELAPEAVDPAQEIYLVADPLAGTRRLTSERIVLRPGAVVEWTIEMELRRAVLSVY